MIRPPRLTLTLALPLGLVGCEGDKTSPDTADTGTEDILDQLAAIDGVTEVLELEAASYDTRFIALRFEQPVDHDAPDGETFSQWVSLVHRDTDAPVVMDTRGYGNSWSGGDNELSWLLGANRLNVEHRYFVESVPASRDWDYLRVEQAAADHHRVATALQQLYTAPWIATGASKGGVTALLYRAWYPDDVAATVAYVAPFSQGYPDGEYGAFFETVGTEECRNKLSTMQRTLMEDKAALVAELETMAASEGESFTRVGVEMAFEVSVAELSWTFWQYSSACDSLPPDPTDARAVWEWLLGSAGPPWGYADSSLSYYGPYFYQCAAELGYPSVSYAAIADLLTVDPDDIAPLLPTDELPAFDDSAVLEASSWLSTQGSELLLVYGGLDPWTARALELDGATDSYSFLSPNANHGALILTLPEVDRNTALDALQRWTGVTIGETARRARTPPPEVLDWAGGRRPY